MANVIHSMEKWLTYIERFALGIATIVLVIMPVIIAVDTVLRYFFHKPIIGILELTEGFFMVAIIYLGMSSTLAAGEHIRVDFLSKYIKGKFQIVNEIVLNLIAIVFFLVIGLQAWKRAAAALEFGQTTTGAIALPVAPAYFLVVFGVFLLCVRMLISTIRISIDNWNVKEG